LERRIAGERAAHPRPVLEGELNTGIAKIGGHLACGEQQLPGLTDHKSFGRRFWPGSRRRDRCLRRSGRCPATAQDHSRAQEEKEKKAPSPWGKDPSHSGRAPFFFI